LTRIGDAADDALSPAKEAAMTAQPFTLIQGPAATAIDVAVNGDTCFVTAAALESATGWAAKPEGFCQGDVCIPAGTAISDDGNVDLIAFARLTGRPLVLDADEHAISLGAAAQLRAQTLTSLQAPDFTLPDLSGSLHSLAQYRGRKILLAAYASW
jgi:hypothetical protein